jgi:uncharacterized protein YfaQ (DUF2300 family)
MVRTQIQLSEKQMEQLRQLAEEREVSLASLIRLAVARFLQDAKATSEDEKRARAKAAVGRFRSSITDISKNHDDYLIEAYKG